MANGPAIFDFGESFEAPSAEPNPAPAPAAYPQLGVGGDTGPGVVPSAIVTGLRDIPLAGTLFERLLTEGAGVNRELLEQMARTANSSPLGKGLTFASSFVPELLLGAGAFSLGRRLLVGGLRVAIPESFVGYAAPEGVGATANFLQRSMGRVAARARDVAGGPTDPRSALNVLGITPGSIPKPLLERGAEIVGGATGIGGFYGFGDLVEGRTPTEAAKTAAFAAALTGVSEAAFTAGAKLLFPGAREADVGKLLSKTEYGPTYLASRQSATQQLSDIFAQRQAKMVELHGVPDPNYEKIAKAEQRVMKAITSISGADRFFTMSPMFTSYLRDTPRERYGAVQQLMMRFAKTPDQMKKEMGPATAKVVYLMQEANSATSMARSLNNIDLRKVSRTLQAGAGVRRHGGGRYLLPHLDRWQRRQPLTGKDATKLQEGFDAMEGLALKAEEALVQVGLVPPRQPTRGRAAIRELPLVLDRLSPTDDLLGKLGRLKGDDQLAKELKQALVKAGRNEVDADGLAHQIVFGHSDKASWLGHRDPRKYRSIWALGDEQSLNEAFKGFTFQEVLEMGAPIIRDPLVAVEAHLNSMARRVAYASRLGPGGSLARSVFRNAAKAQGDNLDLYDNIVEAGLAGSYGTLAEQSLAAAVVNSQTATRMAFGVLPNMAQPANIAVLLGGRGFIQGLFKRWGKGPIQEAAEASAIGDSLIRGWRETFLDPYFRTPYGMFSDAVLLGTGFTAVERWNRKWAFTAAAHYAMRQLPKAVEGRLRGSTLDIARRRFNNLGLDLDDLVRLARRQPGTSAQKAEAVLMGNDMEIIKRAGMGGVRATQFLPDKTRLPTFWNTPGGRVIFQFKSFALNQSRLIRDSVINEAAKGNMNPLLYLMGGFPLAGELVSDLRQLIRDGELKRPSSPIVRLVENAAAVGGFGIAGDFTKAAITGPNTLYRALTGPTVEDVMEGVSAIVRQDFDAIAERASRLPTYRAALSAASIGLGLGMEGTATIREAMEYYLAEPSEGEGVEPIENAPTLQELMVQQKE